MEARGRRQGVLREHHLAGMAMTPIERLLFQEEGLVLHAYRDHKGYWTIGIGRLIDKRRGGRITEEEAFYLLRNDIAKRETALDVAIPWWRTLDEPRQAVLMSMAFQLGVAGLLAFKVTLKSVEDDRFEDAAHQMLISKWAKVDTPARANRLAKVMRTGKLEV